MGVRKRGSGGLICLWTACLTPFFATAQQGDEIVLDGVEATLNTNPLESLIADKGWEPPSEASRCTSNWREYLAHWEIQDDKLYLLEATIGVRRDQDEERRSILADLFAHTPPILADWYSGSLIIPDGKQVEYVHMGYGSTYDH